MLGYFGDVDPKVQTLPPWNGFYGAPPHVRDISTFVCLFKEYLLRFWPSCIGVGTEDVAKAALVVVSMLYLQLKKKKSLLTNKQKINLFSVKE